MANFDHEMTGMSNHVHVITGTLNFFYPKTILVIQKNLWQSQVGYVLLKAALWRDGLSLNLN